MQSTHASSRHVSCSSTPQRTHDLTHKHRSTPQSYGSRRLTSLPGLKSKSSIIPAHSHSKLGGANETREWACAKRPIPSPHARITTHHSRSQHGQGGGTKEAHLGFLVGESVNSQISSCGGNNASTVAYACEGTPCAFYRQPGPHGYGYLTG